MPAHRNPYGAVERHAAHESRSRKERAHKAGRDGLVLNGGTSFAVGHEEGGIPNIEDDDGDGGGTSGTKLPTVTITGTEPTPTEADVGKFLILYEATKGSILKVCLNDGNDNYYWQPIVNLSAGGF